MGLAVGPRSSGLAHRVLGDGGERVRPCVRDPRRRSRSRLPASRERARAVTCAGSRVRAHLDAQRDARVRRREDVEVARQRHVAAQRARHVGTRGDPALLHVGALAQADRLLRRDACAGEGAGRCVPQLLSRRTARRRGRRDDPRGGARRRARRRLQHARGARALPRVARPRGVGFAALGARPVRAGLARRGRERRRRRSRRSPSSGATRAPRRTSPAPIACATRSRPRAGKCATSPSLPAIGSFVARDAGAPLRASSGARSAAWAARGARAVGERARCAERGVAARGRAAAGADEARARPVRGRGHARPPGRRRLVRAVPLRGRVRTRGRRIAAARVPRPGQRPSQSRRGDPERRGSRRERRRRPGARLCERHGRGLPLLGRGRGAPSGCRRAEPRALSRRDQERRRCGLRARWGSRERRCGRPTYPATSPSCSAPRGKASGRSCVAPATSRSRSHSSAWSSP